VPPSILPAGARGGTSAQVLCSPPGAAERLVSFIRLLGGVPTRPADQPLPIRLDASGAHLFGATVAAPKQRDQPSSELARLARLSVNPEVAGEFRRQEGSYLLC
jgi:hypothetical protein